MDYYTKEYLIEKAKNMQNTIARLYAISEIVKENYELKEQVYNTATEIAYTWFIAPEYNQSTLTEQDMDLAQLLSESLDGLIATAILEIEICGESHNRATVEDAEKIIEQLVTQYDCSPDDLTRFRKELTYTMETPQLNRIL